MRKDIMRDPLLHYYFFRFADDNTVVHFAAEYAREEMMERTLQNMGVVALDTVNSENFNILHSAVKGNNEKSLMVILKWINKLKGENESIGKESN